MLCRVMDIIIITTIKLIIDDFLEPILSIIIPSNIPPRTSPTPNAIIAKNTYEYYSLSDNKGPDSPLYCGS